MIIDGRALAKEVLMRTKERAEKLPRPPKVIAYVAHNPALATRSYVNIKKRSAEVAGCIFEETSNLNFFQETDAAIIQLPTTPEAMALLNQIPIEKDADVLSSAAREKFERGDTDAILPPVVGAVKKILKINGVELKGKRTVVIGNGFLVGAPVAVWLRQQGADVEIVTLESGNLKRELLKADIIVSGAGSPHLITPDMLIRGVMLIDAGTSESNGKVVGDAEPACAEKCSLFTPVPGGVGPLAVACLFENVVALAERNA